MFWALFGAAAGADLLPAVCPGILIPGMLGALFGAAAGDDLLPAVCPGILIPGMFGALFGACGATESHDIFPEGFGAAAGLPSAPCPGTLIPGIFGAECAGAAGAGLPLLFSSSEISLSL